MRATAIVAGLTGGPLWTINDARASNGIPRQLILDRQADGRTAEPTLDGLRPIGQVRRTR
jgi:hypothetical protein